MLFYHRIYSLFRYKCHDCAKQVTGAPQTFKSYYYQDGAFIGYHIFQTYLCRECSSLRLIDMVRMHGPIEQTLAGNYITFYR